MTINKIFHSDTFKFFELLFFYLAVPVIFKIYVLEGWWKILPLFVISGLFLYVLLLDDSFNKKVLYGFNKKQFRRSSYRLIIIGVLLTGFTWWFYPYLLFDYMVEKPKGYIITFFLYPLVSVLPQELVYRVYFFHRYACLFKNKVFLVFVNALLFGYLHVLYDNWVAPIATFLAGILFIYNYYKSRRLLNVSFEHYIYGIILFTVGLGYYFQ